MLRKLFDHRTITILLPTKPRIYVRIGLSRYQLILTGVPFITALRVLDPWHLPLRIWLPGLWASLVNRLKGIGDESIASPPIHALQRLCYREFLLLTIYYNLAKALFVPCDSHGFQRLIKDVLEIPHYKVIQFQIMLVINTFRRSPLRLLILREKPKPCYGKTSALVLAVLPTEGPKPVGSNLFTRTERPLRHIYLMIAPNLIMRFPSFSVHVTSGIM